MLDLSSLPARIQLKRTAGWRKPEGCIVVARPSRWGNWRKVSPVDIRTPLEAVLRYATDLVRMMDPWNAMGRIHSSWEDKPVYVIGNAHELAGHPLGCWCPLDGPCHADVLLVLANLGPEALVEWLTEGMRIPRRASAAAFLRAAEAPE